MSSMLSSQGLVLATAMVVSTTLAFIAFSRPKTFSQPQISQQPQKKSSLRSCLSSGEKKRERKKKKVHFAKNVEEKIVEGEEFREQLKNYSIAESSCKTEIRGIPENRIALYGGILKDRVQRMECSH